MRLSSLCGLIGSFTIFVTYSVNAKTVELKAQTAEIGFSPNAGANAIILEAIKNAKKSIDIAAYVITSDEIFNSIVESHNRGVSVKLVVDAKTANMNGSDVKALLEQNIPVRLNNQFRIMHNKYIIIDGVSVQTGSFNYSANANKRNAENALYILEQPSIAKLYSNNFEKLFNSSKEINNIFDFEQEIKKIEFLSTLEEFNWENNTSFDNSMDLQAQGSLDTYKTVQIKSGKAEVAFSKACNYIPASPSAKNLILQIIENAKSSIYIAAYNFTDPAIIGSLMEKVKKGIKINVVLDGKDNSKNKALQELKNAGANIYLNSKFSIMHNKYIIIDNKTLEMGSFNYTNSAEEEQCNNILVFYNQNELLNYYMQDWNMLRNTSNEMSFVN